MNPIRFSPAARLLGLLPMWLLVAATISIAPQAKAATQGSGRAATEVRPVGEFEAIALSGSMNLEVKQAAKESLTVTADDNILPLLETVVEGKTLHVRFKRGESISTRTKVRVQVEVVKLSSLAGSGAGDMLIDGLKTPLLKLSIAGSGDARFKALATDALEVRVAGSGDVRGDGVAKQLKLSIAGSGDVGLMDMVADDVTVSIAGSGDAQVTANKSLTATVAGSGDVQYRGNAAAIKTTVMGSGSITKK